MRFCNYTFREKIFFADFWKKKKKKRESWIITGPHSPGRKKWVDETWDLEELLSFYRRRFREK